MEKKHVCKICDRRFANGKAMGGHMRSHLAKLPFPPKPTLPSSNAPPLPPQPSKSSPTALSPSSEVNHMQQRRSNDFHECSNETDSAKKPTGPRSKRLRKLPSDVEMVVSPLDSVSSVVLLSADEASCIEDAARSLLMLSRDRWTGTSTRKKQVKPEAYGFMVDGDEDLVGAENMVEEDENDDDDELYCITKHGAKAKFKCETCNKVFKSHQALGGHRASHKNKQILREEDEDEDEDEEGEPEGSNGGFGSVAGDNSHQQRIFECPFCDKAFKSGQALGGHKKVHFTFLAVPDKVSNDQYETTSSSSATLQMFDLNQPAREDDHHEC